MPTTSGDAPIDVPPQECIANLAKLYDRFAHALDPYSPECDEAERAFLRELSVWGPRRTTLPPPFRGHSFVVRVGRYRLLIRFEAVGFAFQGW
jgi:hypothetical protein